MFANTALENLNKQIENLQKENAQLKSQLGMIGNTDSDSIYDFIDHEKTFDEKDKNLEYFNLKSKKGEDWFKSVFENAVSGIVFRNISGIILLVNSAFEKLIGYTSREIMGKPIESFIYFGDRQKEEEMMQKAISANQDYYRFEKRYTHKDSHVVWVDISVSIMRNDDGEATYLVSVVNDITEKKENELKLIKALEFNEKINQTSPVGIVKCDKDGGIVFANQQAEEVLGLHKQDLTQRAYNSPVWEISDFEGNDFPVEKLPFIIVKQTGKTVYDVQHAINWPDGKKVFLSINASPQFENNGEFNGMIATVEDITAKINNERELQESFQFRNSIIKNAAEGLCVCHNCSEFPNVYFTIWNEQMTKITGYTIDEINKLGWYQSLYPDLEIQKNALEKMQRMREGIDIVAEEWEIKTKNGDNITISISTSVIKSDADKTYVMALITDVTEKEKHRATIELQNKTLEELNATKNKFFSIISHDLRGPVGQLYSISELLYNERHEMDEKQIDFFLKSMMDSSEKGQMLLNDLLNWSKSQMNKLELSPENYQVSELFNQAVFMLDDTLKAKEIEVLTNDNDLTFFADVNSIKTVLRNLLFNAIKFSYRGSKVKLDCVKNSVNHVTISISDSGVGIPADRIETLFQIEKLNSTAGTENEMGTGLGLSICKEFILKNKGTIWIESKAGKGSTFFFTLPCI